MIEYVLRRLQIDAEHLLSLSRHESAVGHTVVKGRLREILVNNILTPWLPLGIKCGTGVVVGDSNDLATAGQDDVLLYDELLAPQVLGSSITPDGVFFYNSVLCRIEVKSKITRAEPKAFIEKSQKIASLKFTVRSGYVQQQSGAFNVLFAYESDCVNVKNEYDRMLQVFGECNCKPESGVVSMVCIPGIGFLKINILDGKRAWQKLISPNAVDHIAYFVACVSSSCYDARVRRQNRDPIQSLEGGIGMYLDSPYEDIR